jgi:hypothetical protein
LDREELLAPSRNRRPPKEDLDPNNGNERLYLLALPSGIVRVSRVDLDHWL